MLLLLAVRLCGSGNRLRFLLLLLDELGDLSVHIAQGLLLKRLFVLCLLVRTVCLVDRPCRLSVGSAQSRLFDLQLALRSLQVSMATVRPPPATSEYVSTASKVRWFVANSSSCAGLELSVTDG